MLPLGVVIPTKNSMPYLPRHVEGLTPWLDLAAEVVVVDSDSTDGTQDYLRAQVKHRALQFTRHPPGLYASWNHGIAQIRSPYVYLATTGDTITREGIGKLVEVAESLACDVVISKPAFLDASGRTAPDIAWPIDDIIAELGLVRPQALRQLEAVTFAAVHVDGALTSSCASGLFRSATVQRLPFPTDFGTSGDAAWGVQHAAELRWGVIPEKFSTFLLHPTNASAEERKTIAGARRLDAVLREAAQRWCRTGTLREGDLALIGWDELLAGLTGYLDDKTRFDQLRRGRLPWILNPLAWAVRSRRTRRSARLRQLKRLALARVRNP